MTEEEIHAWITFSTVPDMGLEDAVRLLGDFGSPGAVLDSSLSELRHAVTDELARRKEPLFFPYRAILRRAGERVDDYKRR